MQLDLDRVESPIGNVLVVGNGRCVYALDFEDCEDRMMKLLQAHFGTVELVENSSPSKQAEQVRRYLDGNLEALDRIEVKTGGTPFQREVWSALRKIPAGKTASYADIARKIGRGKAARAVGAANGSNPVVLVVPCHRVISADGTLGGYGGGLDRKRWLLRHEGCRA